MAKRIDTQARIVGTRLQDQGSAPAAPDSGYSIIFSKSDGLYLENNAGQVVGPFITGSAPNTAHDSWLVDILATVSDRSATSGTWTVTAFTNENITYPFGNAGAANVGMAALLSDGVQNSSVSWAVVLSAGTWNATIYCRKSNNTGIFTLNLDGASQGTADSYSAAIAAGTLTITGWTVPTTGKHVIQLQMATKNGSSAGYYGEIFAISLRRTS